MDIPWEEKIVHLMMHINNVGHLMTIIVGYDDSGIDVGQWPT